MKKIIFILFIVSIFYSSTYAQLGIGAVEDSFKEDYRKTPFPRDNNADIIQKSDITDRLKDNDTQAIYIKSFAFIGNRVFSKSKLQKLLVDFIGRDLTISDINYAASIITDYYYEKGYITSYAFIPPQLVNDDVVTINVVEGDIGSLSVINASDYKLSFIEKHFNNLDNGTILKSSKLKRSLYLLNSYLDLKAVATLKAGEKFGTSDIIINVTDTNPYRLNIALDNYGSDETAKYRLSASTLIGNVITSGDKLSLFLSMGLDSFSPEDLFFGRLDYSIPIGYNGLRAGLAYSHSNFAATGDFKALNLKGSSNEYSIYVEYPLFLFSKFTMNVQGLLKKKDSVEQVFGENIEEDSLYAVSGVIFGDIFPWRSSGIYYNLSLDYGISDKPYSKVMAEITYLQYITNWLFVQINGGYGTASGDVTSTEKFYIGGVYSVRGFKGGILSGDSGYKLSGEVTANIFTPKVRATIFADMGATDETLTSVGVGVSWNIVKGLNAKVEYALPLNSNENDEEEIPLYFKLSYSL